jgi:UDP-glucose:glycoprotein glucosyltransferase
LSDTAKQGKTSYRVRHKPSSKAPTSPLVVNGYGVELQLKRTDYIVIDDRQAEQGEKSASQKPMGTGLDDDEDVADLKPLSKDEVADLGLKAASFVTQSEKPMDTLMKLVQDFPKYSSIIAAHNASEDFLDEHLKNREQLLPTGYNVIWINGVQIPARDVNPYSLLAHLRRERKLINGIRSQGLSGSEVISLLSHPSISDTQTEDEPQRYDFRDATEGGNIILWLNDIENDPMYEGWPSELRAVSRTIYIIDSELIITAVAAKNIPRSAAILPQRHSQCHRRCRLDFSRGCYDNTGYHPQSHQARYSAALGYRSPDRHSGGSGASKGGLPSARRIRTTCCHRIPTSSKY